METNKLVHIIMEKKRRKKSKPWFPKLSKKMHAEEPMEISSLVRNYRNGNEVKNYMC
jgi:hypothetical protein